MCNKILTRGIHFLSLCMGLSVLLISGKNLHAKPVISHEAIKSAVAGKAITVIANISDTKSEIRKVFLHFTPSRNAAPIKINMQATGVGVYYGKIPERFTRNNKKLYYYLEASSRNGEWSESPWHAIVLGDLVESSKPPSSFSSADTEEDESLMKKKWFWPAVIGGGVALVAGGIALSSGGGGGGDSSSSGTSTSTDGQIVVEKFENQTASNLTFPQDTTLVATGLNGRNIVRVEVTLNYNPADVFPESFAILYNNAVLSQVGPVSTTGQITGGLQGNSDTVIIRVRDSQINAEGLYSYSWNATATFFVE